MSLPFHHQRSKKEAGVAQAIMDPKHGLFIFPSGIRRGSQEASGFSSPSPVDFDPHAEIPKQQLKARIGLSYIERPLFPLLPYTHPCVRAQWVRGKRAVARPHGHISSCSRDAVSSVSSLASAKQYIGSDVQECIPVFQTC
jgi:hypothetical protein